MLIKILGMGTLRHLSVNTRLKRPLMMEGVLGPLFAAVEDKTQDIDLLRQCSSILAYCSENAENQISMIKDGVLPRLVHLAGVDHPEVQLDVARTYASLTANAENHIGVFGAMEINSMFKLTESMEENCRRDALVSLGNLAIVAKNQLMIVRLGGLSFIARAIESEFESVQRFACRVIYRLAAHTEIQSEVSRNLYPHMHTTAHMKYHIIIM